MPYKVTKNKNGSYKVINKETKKVHAYSTTLEKAKSQIRLMEMEDSKDKKSTKNKSSLLVFKYSHV